jgi:hypothetical protein
MDERSQRLINQLLEKTNQGKLTWTTAFEDGQFKTVLPGGSLAFVVQVKGDVRKFMMLDDHQEAVLDESIARMDTENEPAHHPKLMLYMAIQKLFESARLQALQVDDKLAKAEKLLAAI